MTEKVFITGGTGTLGRAILRRAEDGKEGTEDKEFTVYSRDPMKQMAMPKYRHIKVNYVMGDILDYESLYKSMIGHDTVIHAAAMKHIPQGQREPTYTQSINVQGSWNVLTAVMNAQIARCVGVSTDKAAYPANVYGCTKLMMEHLFIEFSRFDIPTRFTLCRYGNVIGSNGSVLEVWKRQADAGEKITLTNPDMTRFWITEDQAVDMVWQALKMPSGTILIPNAPGMDIGTLANLATGKKLSENDVNIIGLRPGEKLHECLLTKEETPRATTFGDYIYLYPEGTELNKPSLRSAVYSNDAPADGAIAEMVSTWMHKGGAE